MSGQGLPPPPMTGQSKPVSGHVSSSVLSAAPSAGMQMAQGSGAANLQGPAAVSHCVSQVVLLFHINIGTHTHVDLI